MKKTDDDETRPRKQCAALPYRFAGDGGIEVMLVTSRETRRWVIPKGWPIPKLQPNETAAREAYEEAGLAGSISKKPYGSFTYEKRLKSRAFVTCAVDVYLLEVEKTQKRWPERDERERRWFDPQTAAELVDEDDLAALIAALPEMLRHGASAKKRSASG